MLVWLLRPFTAVSALAVGTVSLLSRKYERVRLYYHLGMYLSILGATSLWGVFLSIAATAAGQRLNINYYVARSFYHVCSPAIGIKLEVEGREHLDQLESGEEGKKQCAVIVGNHQSVLDILYLGRILPKRVAMMAKQELFWYPLLGQFMALSGAVFINRRNRQSAVDVMARAGKEMKRKGVSLWVFPEGTRSSSAESKILPFKKGAFHLAVQAQVPIVPVVCENYHRLFDGKTRMNQGTLRIRVLAPIPTTGLGPDDVTALAESTHDQMLATLKDISRDGQSETARAAQSSSPTSSSKDESALQKAGEEKPISQEHADDDSRDADSSDGLGTKDSSDGTEDEMDEDAVLLKRPTDEQTA